MKKQFLMPETAKAALAAGRFDRMLSAWYGVSGSQLLPYRKRIADAVDRFSAQYGERDRAAAGAGQRDGHGGERRPV